MSAQGRRPNALGGSVMSRLAALAKLLRDRAFMRYGDNRLIGRCHLQTLMARIAAVSYCD
jgi:hypothetical protein